MNPAAPLMRRLPCCLIVLAGLTVLGCRSRQAVPEGVEAKNLRAIGVLFGRHQAAHRGKGPANDQEFKSFIRSMSKQELEGMGVDPANLDKLFVSERDGQPFVVRYKAAAGGAPGAPTVVAYEKEGQAGKRFAVTNLAGIELLDEAEFKRKVPEGP